jgi:hypothetical protein
MKIMNKVQDKELPWQSPEVMGWGRELAPLNLTRKDLCEMRAIMQSRRGPPTPTAASLAMILGWVQES